MVFRVESICAIEIRDLDYLTNTKEMGKAIKRDFSGGLPRFEQPQGGSTVYRLQRTKIDLCWQLRPSVLSGGHTNILQEIALSRKEALCVTNMVNWSTKRRLVSRKNIVFK